MAKPTPSLDERLAPSADGDTDLPDSDFLEGWRLITGEPPAILLDSWAEMLALLVESTPEVPLGSKSRGFRNSKPSTND